MNVTLNIQYNTQQQTTVHVTYISEVFIQVVSVDWIELVSVILRKMK